jgi:hypothetical protein
MGRHGTRGICAGPTLCFSSCLRATQSIDGGNPADVYQWS